MELHTFTEKMSNAEIKKHIMELQALLPQRNVIGYLAAYNTRVLSNAISEFAMFEQEAISKYGEKDLDESGNPTGAMSIKIGSEKYNEFIKEMTPYLNIVQEVQIAKADYQDVIGILSGEEILSVEWMLKDDGGETLWPR